MLRRWIWPLTVAAQLGITAAPHPFGVRDKKPPMLFAPAAPSTLPEPSTTRKSKILCGTLLVEADPRVDSKMTQEPRTDETFSIRTYPRPACGSRPGVASAPKR